MSGVFHRIEPVSLPLTEISASEIIDVRSPAEYAEDHLSGAINLPVLDDAERALVGQIYCRESPFIARKLGAALIAERIAGHLRTHFADKPKDYFPLLYCWRGGQRSRSLAIILAEIGWPVRVLQGGYKAYRGFVSRELESRPAALSFQVLNGLTGSGKTLLLHALAARGAQVLDLEGLANHRGSLFGGFLADAQPPQKRFESRLFDTLTTFTPTQPVFVEAESPKIGGLFLPAVLWRIMQAAPVFQIDTPVEERASYIARDYGDWVAQPERVLDVLAILQPRHPRELVEHWQALVAAHAWPELARSLLEKHYDERYGRDGTGHYTMPARRFPLANHAAKTVDALASEILAALPK